MNKEEILAITDLPILNVLIAEDVMGWRERVDFDYVDGYIARYIPDSMDVKEFSPSTDIAAAWEVVDKLKLKLQIFTYFHNAEGFEDGWCVKIDGKHVEGLEKAPEAICKAALLCCLEGK